MKLPEIIPETGSTERKRKVLQRLELFELQRGYTLIEPHAGTKDSEDDSDKTKSKEQSKISEIEAIAAAYLSTCQQLSKIDEDLENGIVGAETTDVPDRSERADPPKWRSIGPSKIPDGQTYGSGRVDVSGRISCIAIDPSNADHILCGSAAGGVWETYNGGRNWYPRTDNMPSLATGAIAFDPSDPNIVYTGTGEGNFYANLGAGILRSTNGGSSWSVLTTTPFVGVGFYDLEVDINDGQIITAGTTNGLYQSTDGGLNWRRIFTNRAWKISRASNSSGELLAAMGDGVKRSMDNGTNWTSVNLPGAPANWRRLSVDHVKADPRIAYAFGTDSGKNAFLYRRQANGVWRRITDLPSDLSTGQDWYDWFLAAAPDRTDQVYLGAINVHRGDMSGRRWSWVNLSAKTSGDSIHPDQHAIQFHPTNSNIVFVGNDGGMYRSDNRGVNWRSLNTNLAITEMEYVAQDNGTHRWFIGGTQDNGTNRYNGSTVWKHVADGDGGDCSVNSITPNVVFHSFFGMGLRRSTNKGDSWGGFIQNGRSRPGYSALFYPPMESNGNTVCQAGESLFISRNSGSNWAEVNLPRGVASSMYIPNPNTIFVGTTEGRIYRTQWNRTRWSTATEINSPRTNAYISDLHVNPRNLNSIWITYTTIGNGRTFYSSNGGTTWQDRTNGLPNIPIRAVMVDPTNSNRVWIAADIGVYQSFNNGRRWTSFSHGLPNVLVGDLLYNPHTRMLRAGTRNRGVWEIPVNGDLNKPICGKQWDGSLRPGETRRWFTFRWPATWHMLWTVMPTTFQSAGPQLKWNVQVTRGDAEYTTYWITVKNLTNRDVTFEGRYCITNYY